MNYIDIACKSDLNNARVNGNERIVGKHGKFYF